MALLELAAERLGELREEVAFLGGASLGLWIDDPGAPEPRVTIDVDVIVVVNTKGAYYELAERLRDRGFQEDEQSNVICRWRDRQGLILDVMPTDAEILGFTNSWYKPAIEHAETVKLPSGLAIQAVAPPYLLATKLEAFRNRGHNDYLASADFEDVVRLVDGRTQLLAEVRRSASDVREFIVTELHPMVADERFIAGVAGALLPDAASQARRPIVLERFTALASTFDG